MERLLTSIEKDKLIEQKKLKDLYTNDYLNDTNNENFKLIAELFFASNTSRAKLFNVGTNLFATVADVISNFTGNPTLGIEINLTDFTTDLVSVGKAVFGLKRVDDIYSIYHIPAETHLVSDGIHTVYTTYETIEKEKSRPVYYILKQKFFVGYIENKLYKKEGESGGKEVPLDTIPETENLQEIMQTGLDTLSIFYTEKTELPGIQSELDKIKQMVYSLDRKAVMFETQFLKEVDQYKIFNNINIGKYIDSDGNFNTSEVGKVLINEIGMDGDIKFVSNKNELIDKAIDYETIQVRRISSATSIPTDFLGISETTAISGTSRALMMGGFIKKIQDYRNQLTKVLMQILEVIEGTKNKDGNIITKDIIWEDIVSKTDKELVEELKIARESGIISKYTSIQKYLKFNEEQTMDELEWIKKEDTLYSNQNTNGIQS